MHLAQNVFRPKKIPFTRFAVLAQNQISECELGADVTNPANKKEKRKKYILSQHKPSFSIALEKIIFLWKKYFPNLKMLAG